VAYVCQACAANEALVRAFATRQMAEWQGQQLRFRRLPFIKRTVFDVVFADLAHSVEDGSVVAAVPDGGSSRGGG
jgi:hypothetical protein